MLSRILCLSAFLWSPLVQAQMLADPLASAGSMGLTLGLTEVDYENSDSNNDFDIERTTLAFEWNGHGEPASVFFQGGYTLDAEIGNTDGDGFTIGGGMRKKFKNNGKVSYECYALLNIIRESYKVGSASSDLSLIEIHIAPAVRFHMSQDLQLYGVLELIPFSRGEIKTKAGGLSAESDIERDDLLNIKLGARINIGKNLIFRPEISLFSESSLILGLTFL